MHLLILISSWYLYKITLILFCIIRKKLTHIYIFKNLTFGFLFNFKVVLLDGFVLCCIYKKEKKAVQKAGDFIVRNEELVPSLSAAITISTSIEEHFKSFPSGLLFSPTDTELVVYYLWVKNNFGGRYLPINRIHEVELYNYHPQHLTGTLLLFSS